MDQIKVILHSETKCETFYSNSVYMSGTLLYAESGIVQLNASPKCTAGSLEDH